MAHWNSANTSLLNRTTMVVSALLVVALIIILHFMGRIPMCTCGFGLFTADAWGSENSQMLFDPYSLSHILHGFIFFYFLFIFRKKIPLHWALVAAIGIEIAWEIFENSPFIINRYRTATASLNYFGDSILNSFGDVVSMAIGFFLAAKLSWKVILPLFILIELVMLFTIRDNLTLNILMLIHPIESISVWQQAH